MTNTPSPTRFSNVITRSDLVQSLLEEYDWKISRDEAESLADKILEREKERLK